MAMIFVKKITSVKITTVPPNPPEDPPFAAMVRVSKIIETLIQIPVVVMKKLRAL